MTYAIDDKSVHDGQPIRLFKFVGPAASYLYTSFHDQVSHAGDTYEPTTIQSASRSVSSSSDVIEFTVELPKTTQLAIDYLLGIQPQSLSLTVFERHGVAGETVTIWEGEYRGASLARGGDMAIFRTSSRFDETFSAEAPRPTFQPLCNHRLYDARCQVNEALFDHTTLAQTVAANGVDITLNSNGGQADGFYDGGEIERALDGERRLIISQTGNDITIATPFDGIAELEIVKVFAGCDRRVRTCLDKFDNVKRFTAFPDIPEQNIVLYPIKALRR